MHLFNARSSLEIRNRIATVVGEDRCNEMPNVSACPMEHLASCRRRICTYRDEIARAAAFNFAIQLNNAPLIRKYGARVIGVQRVPDFRHMLLSAASCIYIHGRVSHTYFTALSAGSSDFRVFSSGVNALR